jgi:hypothetical protein
MSEPSVAETCRAALQRLAPAAPVVETGSFDPSVPGAPRPGPIPSGPLAPGSWLLCATHEAVGPLWPGIDAAFGLRAGAARVLARRVPAGDTTFRADLALFGSLPGTVVAAPTDGPQVAKVVQTLLERSGPAYVRLPADGPALPGEAGFSFGRAPERRAGTDLAVWAVGSMLAPALALAERLHGIGIEARVLDGASVKPLDVPAVLRAARETGAILTVEEHPASYGVGAAVAAVAAGSYPVPVRRVGWPDLADGRDVPASAFEIGPARLDEEAWELLKARGKVH